MLKKILCLIAITMVLSVFDAPAMDSVDHSSTESLRRSEQYSEDKSFEERLIKKQIEIILKKKRSHKLLESDKDFETPKLTKL